MEPNEKSLLEWLYLRYPESPKKRIKSWFLAGRVKYLGQTIKEFQRKVSEPGDDLELSDKSDARGFQGSNIRIHQQVRMVYIDKEIVVVNKSAGLLSVPAPDREQASAYDYVFQFLNKHSIGTATLFPVHRLDEYTSGLLCFALTESARESLIEQLKSHTLERNYIAYVEGSPKEKSGTWEHSLLLSPSGYDQKVVPHGTSDSVVARTHFEVIKNYKHPSSEGMRYVTKLRIKLETGLRHQIRIQAAEAGFPLIGDRKYHPAYEDLNPHGKGKQTDRQALHAVRLGMIHPASGEYLKWEVPLPKDLTYFEADLKEQSTQRRYDTSE